MEGKPAEPGLRRRIPLVIGAAFMLAIWRGAPHAEAAPEPPWANRDTPIVLDPFGSNPIDWGKLAGDTQVKAIVHKASEGLTRDGQYRRRAVLAHEHRLLWGAYHLGRPGDPVRQAELLLDQVRGTQASFLALDIEGLDSGRDMSLKDAETFLDYVRTKTGRVPALYVNYSTFLHISAHYAKSSTFAKAPLWIARFGPTIGSFPTTVWKDYTLWQFQSESNCKPKLSCPRRVPGTLSDMDVNAFNGDTQHLTELFK